MKMDVDCIRDILLQAEQKGFSVFRNSDDDLENDDEETNSEFPFIEKYDSKKLLYHINLADELGLIKASHCMGFSSVLDLSAQGHLFLADIREDKVWNKTKEISKQVGATSLAAVKEIATNVISNLITNYFQR
jgi:hypothetical protein